MRTKIHWPTKQTVAYSSRIVLYDAVHWMNMDAISYEDVSKDGKKKN